MRAPDIRRSSTGLVAVVLGIALVFMVNYLASGHYKRFDLTSSRLYTLSEKSRNIVKDLQEEIRVIVFMTPGSELYPQVRELLDRYAAASDMIQLEYIDPDREPLRTKTLAEEFGISVANTVVFTAGDRSKYVTSDAMAELDFSGVQMGQPPTVKAFKGEEQFTSAILSLVAPSVPKVYFVTGHGEPSTTPAASMSERSIATLAEALKRENMEVAEAHLLSGQVPDDADVIAIVGPTRGFTVAEIEALHTFLEGGGRALIAMDPLIEPNGTMRATGIEGLLSRWEVNLNDDLVIDPSKKLPFYDLSAVYLDAYRDHPVTQGMEGMAVLFLITRSITPTEGGVHTVTPLVETTPEGWGESNLAQLLRGEAVDPGEGDTPGPVTVALAVEAMAEPLEAAEEEAAANQPGARLVVFGDSDFLSDSEIANAGNAVLATNAFNWLSSQEQALGIPAREVERVSLFMSAGQLQAILFVVLIIMPGAAVAAGIFMWRRRRH
jgi:ABC-type uncharacterized transport system involved in gliding motility auxiliary subunit